MTIKDSSLAGKANYIYNLKSGDLYFYDDFLISEIYEGVIVEKKEIIEIMHLVHKHFGYNKPYGLISHRLYSYSINLYDLLPVANKFGLLVANAVVAYSDISLKTFELEKRLLKLKGESFNQLEKAINWTKNEISLAQNI